MNRLQKWFRGNWAVPVISGFLILASFAVTNLGGGVLNTDLSPRWWMDAGVHAHHGTEVFTLANLLMLVAAVVAG
ncbi:MAG: cation-transporting P-type ATPase, partial [Yaniella sp.]|nr:cation-transporting P-type ATPase [Yaniella sp.]